VNEACKELYCQDNGHPVVHLPDMMFRAAIVQYLYDLSDRETEENVNYNLVYRWFEAKRQQILMIRLVSWLLVELLATSSKVTTIR